MNFALILQNDIVAFLPESFLAICILVVLLHGSFLGVIAASLYTYITPSLVRLTSVILFLSLLLVGNNPVESQTLWNGIFVTDFLGTWAKCVVFVGLLLCVSVSEVYMSWSRFRAYEFFVFILGIALSLCLLISSYDLLSLYLSMEFLSLSFYILATWGKTSYFSAEAGLKYFILGSVASIFYLFGASLVYFVMGTTNLGSLSLLSDNLTSPSIFLVIGLIFMMSALLFKMGSAPYHMWMADVYEGAPTVVGVFFAVVPKVAFFIVVLRLSFNSFWYLFPEIWESFFCVCGLFSLLVGCLCGLGETKIKRLLAFSSLGHVGLLCLGLSCGSIVGVRAVLFYLIIYMLNAAFLWVYVLYLDITSTGSSLTFAGAIGLDRSNPLLCICVIFMIFSIGGIPPFGGFFGKLYILISLVDSSFQVVAIFAVFASVISAFYYIRLVKIFYFEKTQDWFFFPALTKGTSIVLVFCCFSIILFMLVPNFFYCLPHKVCLAFMF